MEALARALSSANWRQGMQDLIYIVLTIVFFLIALAYVRGCEKLQ
jgi:hypothetical protein